MRCWPTQRLCTALKRRSRRSVAPSATAMQARRAAAPARVSRQCFQLPTGHLRRRAMLCARSWSALMPCGSTDLGARLCCSSLRSRMALYAPRNEYIYFFFYYKCFTKTVLPTTDGSERGRRPCCLHDRGAQRLRWGKADHAAACAEGCVLRNLRGCRGTVEEGSCRSLHVVVG